jgi:hypothetical protein
MSTGLSVSCPFLSQKEQANETPDPHRCHCSCDINTSIRPEYPSRRNDAAMAAVIYTIAQKRCNLTTSEDGKLRGMTISEIERHGLTWEQVVYVEKPMIGQFLKEHSVYEKATNNDRAAVRTVCNDARTMLGKKK